MNSLRRAVMRAAVSATRNPSTKTPKFGVVSSFASLSVTRIAAPVLVRCFSQTCRVAAEGDFSALEAQADNSGESTNRPDDEPGFGLFIRNLVFEANEDHLREAYEKYGDITKIAIARDARGLSRGYGFVWFATQDCMEKAVAGTNSSFWHGRRVQVSPRTARTGANRNARNLGPTKSLYIGNIPYETTDAELNRIFRELDNVVDVRVAVDRTTGWPRGFAHADFSDIQACTEGMNKLAGMTINGRQLKLDYAAEASKGPRVE